MTDTPFVSFAFPAKGAPTPRTMPDRLADVKNVKDFGAVGDGGTDDTTAILNAVNWTTGPNRGTIFFPTGFYTIHSPITLNYDPAPGQPGLSIHLLGEGNSTFLNSNATPYAIDRSLATPNNTAQIVIEKMNVPSIRVGSCTNVVLQDLTTGAITTEDSPGNSSKNVSIKSCNISGGVITGASGVIQGNNWTACDVAVRAYGKGFCIYGGRFERCNVGYLLGLDGAVAATFTGTVGHTGTNDNSGILTVTSVASGTIKPWQELSDGGVNVPTGIYITSQTGGPTGGAGTYKLTNPTVTISTAQTINAIGNDRGASGFVIHGGSSEGNYIGVIYGGTCSGFYHGSSGFLGHSDAGVRDDMATQYHLIVGPNASNGTFQGLYGRGDLADVAGCRVDTATSRANLVFMTCNFTKGTSGASGAVDWIFPTNAYTAQWMACNVSPVWTFSQLPSGANALQGDQFTISDPNTNTWGANVTASGSSGQVLVRWNGTNWTVVGK